MHIWEDQFLVEIVDPVTGEALPDGECGELVLTSMHRKGTPLLRYRTRDLTRIIPGPCPCGRTHRRIDRIQGRSDDMMIINGVNIFPMQMEQTLMRIPGIGTQLPHRDPRGQLHGQAARERGAGRGFVPGNTLPAGRPAGAECWPR